MTEQKFEREKKTQRMQLKIAYKDESRILWVNRREDTY